MRRMLFFPVTKLKKKEKIKQRKKQGRESLINKDG